MTPNTHYFQHDKNGDLILSSLNTRDGGGWKKAQYAKYYVGWI